MSFTANKQDFKKSLSNFRYNNEGDSYEKQSFQLLEKYFPNHEKFWTYYIVPLTKRIESEESELLRIRNRENISNDVFEISIFHYSVFMKFCYAYEHINSNRAAAFDEFYAHLSSVCDLIEEFFLRIYQLICEITDKQIEVIQALSKNKFLKIASEWYDTSYNEVHKNYFAKGKFTPIYLVKGKNILDEYFNDNKDWKEYKKYAQVLRTYRNTLIHSCLIGKIHTTNGQLLVPKKEKISNYKNLRKILDSVYIAERVKFDFVDMKTQMIEDFETMQKLLDKLWNVVLSDYDNHFFENPNDNLLRKYDIKYN